jgi:predicted PurR-regulated permease PerM
MAMRAISVIAAFLFCIINIVLDGMMLHAIHVPDNKGLIFTFIVFLLSFLSMIGAAVGVILVIIRKKFQAERLMFYSLYAYCVLNIPNVAALILLPAAAFVILVLKVTVLLMRRPLMQA